MEIHKSFDKLPHRNKVIFTQGTFDGVHLGHQKILSRIKEISSQKKAESLLMTFWPHPRMLLFPDDQSLKLLQTLDEKLEWLDRCGIDNVLVLPFTKEFSDLSPELYISDFLIEKLGVDTVVVGYDHKFGKDRKGDIALLKKFSESGQFHVEEIPAEDISQIHISSTKIRHSLEEGLVEEANAFLGRPYSFAGSVVPGHKIGHQLGYATANIDIPDAFKLIPGHGVYAIIAQVDGYQHYGMMNIGLNPSIAGKGFSIEANLFNFTSDIYNKRIDIQVVHRMRDELYFDNLEDLKLQLKKDEKMARNLFHLDSGEN